MSNDYPRRGELWVSKADDFRSKIILGARARNVKGTMTWDVLITRSNGQVSRTVVVGCENIKRDGIDGEGYYYERMLAAEAP